MTVSNFTFESIVEQLRNNILEVTFTKVNGEQRVMPCTLQPSVLPIKEQGDGIEERSVNQTVVRAFAIDKQAWRSFKVENVLSVGVLSE